MSKTVTLTTLTFYGLAAVLVVGLPGCQVVLPQNQPLTDSGDDNEPLLTRALEAPPAPAPGSLYTYASSMRLFDDLKAYRPGDILTVVLQEMTSSSKKANTSLGKDSAANIAPPTVFGKTYSKLDMQISGNRSFDGKGSTSQQNQLTGSVTVVVQKVLPSGALVVKGSKMLRLNQGDEVVFVSGVVRPEDISQDNQVSSLRLAQAKISYTGRGDLAETNTQGWFSRILNSSWFPF
ncbi:flagellar basal body L-ring protein FlgH [Endozoicomonas sp. SCSIO W0465]|uniref:flagellar basal body L-ring protein FlgH n=1 Tax=Endozoicomonas sp. SCSIO W0465 TaxID=2918516 RepID=UPI0020755E69|nr:flagellar basal body L-ring protein FlgH [Endozoicomonas sp. SCSIO W0465]USE38270.1 flagellar basal body L-ring protein FlgH [Endozoicomonas sp. SCSIO W0465]